MTEADETGQDSGPTYFCLRVSMSTAALRPAQVGGIDAWAVVHAPAYVLAPLWDVRRGDVINVPGVIQVCSQGQVEAPPCVSRDSCQ